MLVVEIVRERERVKNVISLRVLIDLCTAVAN